MYYHPPNNHVDLHPQIKEAMGGAGGGSISKNDNGCENISYRIIGGAGVNEFIMLNSVV